MDIKTAPLISNPLFIPGHGYYYHGQDDNRYGHNFPRTDFFV
jgi:hypothetical protein